MRKRAVAGAEIVERDPDALVFEAADDRLGEAEILEQRAFGDLDFEPVRRKAGFDQQLDDFLGKPGVFQLDR